MKTDKRQLFIDGEYTDSDDGKFFASTSSAQRITKRFCWSDWP